ncbi:hypothetical protein [Streptomyces goshikiensis]|uniref:hypothetical protein n=1 Tax=Streptomyces goshikiensis TaxID=1942 RepID=UPI002AE00952|nr:hypothetical protein [Streptomyces goshikiensis]
MAQWVITAENHDSEIHRFQTVKKFEGTREEAQAQLRAVAESGHVAGVPYSPKRRMVFRYGGEDAYYVRVYGKLSRTRVVFRLAELVFDTDWADKN